ncbi:hypothetical protein KW800_02320 [Candidatus Parcubacteria bacterium]|nr:hypothetical protein [Candidatus Parcubacteria bacterium]
MPSNEINLSSSVLTSFEVVRKALEIRYGAQISFVGSMKITPDDPDRTPGSKRQVVLQTKFDTMKGTLRIMVELGLSAIVFLEYIDCAWRFDYAEVRVQNPNDQSARTDGSYRYTVCYAKERQYDTHLFVGDPLDNISYRGHDMSDRVEVKW